MNRQRLIDHLSHLLEAAQLACSYVEGMNQEDFLVDKKTQQAVLLNLIVIGEVVTQLSKDHADFLEQYPDVPWKNIKNMRNRIAHGYFDIDLNIVWDTVQMALPMLVTKLLMIKQEQKLGANDAT